METILNNYWNGNITDAKKGARRYSFAQIVEALKDLGYGEYNAEQIAGFLKNKNTFQEAADAEYAQKNFISPE